MRVLFIGNSHTYFNDMPHIFKQVCQENNIDMEVTMLARGQVVGVTDNLLVVHNLFTVITILTVVNCIRLYYLSLRNG